MNDTEIEKFYKRHIPRGNTFLLWKELAESTKQWWRDQYIKRVTTKSEPHEYTNPHDCNL